MILPVVRSSLLLALLLWGAACGPGGTGDELRRVEEGLVAGTLQGLASALVHEDWAGAATYFGRDGWWVRLPGDTINGPEAIISSLRPVGDTAIVQAEFTADQVKGDARRVRVKGRYRLEVQAPGGEPMGSRGRHQSLLERAGDGAWFIQEATWRPDPQEPPSGG